MKSIEVNDTIKKQKELGIICPRCGGDVVSLDLPNRRAKLIKTATLGLVLMQTLECDTCHKRFSMF